MSKSLGNCIYLSDSADEVEKVKENFVKTQQAINKRLALLEVAKNILDGKEVERSIKSKESQFLQKDAAKELPNRKY